MHDAFQVGNTHGDRHSIRRDFGGATLRPLPQPCSHALTSRHGTPMIGPRTGVGSVCGSTTGCLGSGESSSRISIIGAVYLLNYN
jgi:hypothetical protein